MPKPKGPRPTTIAYRKEVETYRDPGLFKQKEDVTIEREPWHWVKFLWKPKGRATVAEYWFVTVTLAILGFGGHWLDVNYGGGQTFFPELVRGKIDLQTALLPNLARLFLYALVTWTFTALTLKRFQDCELPLWVLFTLLTPAAGPPLVQMLSPLPSNLIVDLILGVTYLGPLWLFYMLFFQPGTFGENRYGPDPRET
jgi:uncharacterized membrane protein YhaH (DUF805 family)